MKRSRKLDLCLSPAKPYTWPGIFLTKFGSHWALLSKLHLVDLCRTLHDLWHQQCITLWLGVFVTLCWGQRAIWVTLESSNVSRSVPRGLPTKFGSHLAFEWPLTFWVTSKICSWTSRAKPPIPTSGFLFLRQSMAKQTDFIILVVYGLFSRDMHNFLSHLWE